MILDDETKKQLNAVSGSLAVMSVIFAQMADEEISVEEGAKKLECQTPSEVFSYFGSQFFKTVLNVAREKKLASYELCDVFRKMETPAMHLVRDIFRIPENCAIDPYPFKDIKIWEFVSRHLDERELYVVEKYYGKNEPPRSAEHIIKYAEFADIILPKNAGKVRPTGVYSILGNAIKKLRNAVLCEGNFLMQAIFGVDIDIFKGGVFSIEDFIHRDVDAIQENDKQALMQLSDIRL